MKKLNMEIGSKKTGHYKKPDKIGEEREWKEQEKDWIIEKK